MKKKWIFRWCVRVTIVLWIIWGNLCPGLTRVALKDPDLPEDFHGFRIAHLSDLHNTEFGKENVRLLRKLMKAAPDVIVITGDILDSNRTDTAVALAFAANALNIAPCYYVTGNHEGSIDTYENFKKDLKALGVIVLENEYRVLERGNAKIRLYGIDDPNVCHDGIWGDPAAVTAQRLENLQIDSETYSILLSHRPDLMEVYAAGEVDLVLSGHVHGGQFRIPFMGGLYAPSQGFFPEYNAGLYQLNDTQMIVSRGLGNSSFPLRLNNRPEIVLITLQSK